MSTGVQRRSGTRAAWIAVAFIPVGFVVAMVLGEGLLSWQGYESSDEDIPFGAVALAGGSAMAAFVVPCLAAWVLGRRAVAEGEPQGRAPALVGAVVGAVFVLQNLAGMVLRGL